MGLRSRTSKNRTIFQNYQSYRLTNTGQTPVQIGRAVLNAGENAPFDLTFRQMRSLIGVVAIESIPDDNQFNGVNTRDFTVPLTPIPTYPQSFLASNTADEDFETPASIYVPSRGILSVVTEDYEKRKFNFEVGGFVLPMRVRKIIRSQTTIQDIVVYGTEVPYDAKVVPSNAIVVNPSVYNIQKTLLTLSFI